MVYKRLNLKRTAAQITTLTDNGGLDRELSHDLLRMIRELNKCRAANIHLHIIMQEENNPMQHTINTYIAGAKFRPAGAKEALAELPPSAALVLEAESDNQYDPNAIKVLITSITPTAHVGYVPKFLSKKISTLLKQGDVTQVLLGKPEGNLAIPLIIRYEKEGEEEELARMEVDQDRAAAEDPNSDVPPKRTY